MLVQVELKVMCTGDLPLQVNYTAGTYSCFSLVFKSIGYLSLHRSVMGCSLTVTGAGVAGRECECKITHH